METKKFPQNKTIFSFVIEGILIGTLIGFIGYKIGLSIIFLLLGISIFIVTYFLYKDILNPVGLFSFVWLCAIGLSNLHLSPLQSEWTSELWLVLLSGYFAFLTGSFLAVAPPFLAGKVNFQFSLSNEREFLKIKISKNRLKKLIVFLFIISSVAYLYEAYNVGGLPIFSENPLQAYMQFPMHYIHYLAVVMVPLCSLIGLYFALYERPLWMKLSLGVIIFFLVARLARWELIGAILGFLVPIHYLSKRLKLRHFFIFLIIILITIMILGNLRTFFSLEGWNYINVIYGLKLSPAYSMFSWPYVYFASSIENLNKEISLMENYTLGLHTMKPLLAVIGEKGIIPNYLAPGVNIGRQTGTFLLPYYSDFGFIGILIFPFIIGFFTSMVHLLSIKHGKNQSLWIMVYSILIMPILAMGSNNMFAEVSIYFYIAVFLFAYFYITLRSSGIIT